LLVLKRKKGKLSPIVKSIIALAVKIQEAAEKQADPARKASMTNDFYTLMRIRSKYS
jgi:hypothetical protein